MVPIVSMGREISGIEGAYWRWLLVVAAALRWAVGLWRVLGLAILGAALGRAAVVVLVGHVWERWVFL